ncbi:MAG TPA: ABC transporter ATP-binding protein [Desulfosporosinus sp.]|nr:ABC transporter ATP-binding protein [Desulfosporosinus sp.]
MPFLELSQVSYFYPQQSKSALTEIDINFDNEGITAIIGPNGSGKTTLTKLLVGILQPTAGEIRLKGRRLQEYSLAEIGRRIGYIFQNPDQQLFCTTVNEEIGFGLIHQGGEPEAVREKVDFYLEYFELTAYRNVFPLHLSKGEKQRLALAAILANEPEFLILDEPTVGLDAYRKKLLAEYLRKLARLNRGMIIVSHDLNFVMKVADRIIGLEKGQICWDSLQEGNTGHEA